MLTHGFTIGQSRAFRSSVFGQIITEGAIFAVMANRGPQSASMARTIAKQSCDLEENRDLRNRQAYKLMETLFDIVPPTELREVLGSNVEVQCFRSLHAALEFIEVRCLFSLWRYHNFYTCRLFAMVSNVTLYYNIYHHLFSSYFMVLARSYSGQLQHCFSPAYHYCVIT